MPVSQMARSSCMGTRVASCRTASHWSYWKTSARPGPCRCANGLRGLLGLSNGASNFSPNHTCRPQEGRVEGYGHPRCTKYQKPELTSCSYAQWFWNLSVHRNEKRQQPPRFLKDERFTAVDIISLYDSRDETLKLKAWQNVITD